MGDSERDLRDAATVLPLREGDEGLEVYMVRRHPESGFMAERYVYPGGTVDPEDCEPGVEGRVQGMTADEAARRFGGEVEPLRALGHYLAGVRETFEEAGILFARYTDETNFVNLVEDDARRARFEEVRTALADGEQSLVEFAAAERLILTVDRLAYFAHWITPRVESRRFDTRFFVALAPERQVPLHDDRETTDGRWVEPGEALDANERGEILLAPPTLRTLQQLSEFGTAREAFEFARTHRPRTQLPHPDADDEGDVVLYLPGHPEFPTDEPEYRRAEPAGEGPTRFVMVEPGQWRSD